MADPRRAIPRTDALLSSPDFAPVIDLLGRETVKRAVVTAQDLARSGELAADEVAATALAALAAPFTGLRRVINATGVIVHTNLGRAPLSPAARAAVDHAAGSTDLEFDLATGQRDRRGRSTLRALAAAVPEAGGVHVVNNNAAALLLCALALAPGKEIVVSRGELVEIGDGFRIPDLLTSGGARLREVGTTNRTSLRDYADAIGPETAFVLKVHPSNFVVSGFTASVGIGPLATLGVPVVADIGSGLLRPHPLLPDEPDAATALRDGASLVTASGDKLLGGPQAGILVGDAALVERLRRHPSARALRVDKLTLAALEASLTGPPPPVRQSLDAPVAEVRDRAERLAKRLLDGGLAVSVVDTRAVVGGGGAPEVDIDSAGIDLPGEYAVRLRLGSPAVVGRLVNDRCLIDLRTVVPEDEEHLAAAILAAHTPEGEMLGAAHSRAPTPQPPGRSEGV